LIHQLFTGDIAFKDGELIIAGDRKVFFVDVKTKKTTDWYYSPDTLPRGIAVGDGTTHYVSGMEEREIWKVDLDQKAQLKDIRREHEVFAPFWLIIIALIFVFIVVLDEILSRGKAHP
jgi:hypothetical protein